MQAQRTKQKRRRNREISIPALRGRLSSWMVEQVAEAVAPSDPVVMKERVAAAQDIITFTQRTYTPYIVEPVHRLIGDYLNRVVRGEIRRLIITMPPQHGKSRLASFQLPGFWLGNRPEEPVLLTSYAADLAVHRNSRNARAIVESQEYEQIFPHVRPDENAWRLSDWHISKAGGYTLAAGVGGPITGHGFALAIVDDPYENWAAAQSETIRRGVWEWWHGTFYQRLWQGAAVVLILTRWHEDDLVGALLRTEGTVDKGGAWHYLRLPALAEATNPRDDPLGRRFGEALAPKRYSAEYLNRTRQLVGEYVWSAEYQQRPTKPEGGTFQVGKVQIVDQVPAEIAVVEDGTLLEVKAKAVRAWDLAASQRSREKPDPDYTSGVLVAEHEDIWYVLDAVHIREEPSQVETIVQQTAVLDGRRVRVLIEQEPGSSGKAVVDRYIRLLAGFAVSGQTVSGDKMLRAMPFAAQVNAGNVRLLRGAWNRAWLAEHAAFPHGTHDDLVDASACAFNAIAGPQRFRKVRFIKV